MDETTMEQQTDGQEEIAQEADGRAAGETTLPEDQKQPEKKLFTQDEVNEIVKNRLARERKKEHEVPEETPTEAVDYRENYNNLLVDQFFEGAGIAERSPLAEKYIKEEFKKQGFEAENGAFGEDAQKWLVQVFNENPALFSKHPVTGVGIPRVVMDERLYSSLVLNGEAAKSAVRSQKSDITDDARPSKPTFKQILQQLKGK